MSMTCVHPYIPLLCGKTGGIIFFLFLIENKDCGYSLELPRCSKAVLKCTHNRCFEHNFSNDILMLKKKTLYFTSKFS